MSAEDADRFARLRADGGGFLLTNVARFAVTGADRVRYLNGQVSNDVRKLVPGTAMRACVLSVKGRLDAVIWFWAEPDRIVVETEAALAEALAIRLERYIVADDVEITPLPVPRETHVFGAAAAGFADGRKISRMNLPGVDVAGDVPPSLTIANEDEIERLRIERLVPRWGAELGPDTLPAEAGLDRDAVDFHKGCYLGQEVVSRVQSVGHVNRSLRVFDVTHGAAPAAGAELFAAAENDRAAAVVTSIHLSPPVGLCYIRRGTPEEAALTTSDGASRIRLRPPTPFA